MRRLKLRKEKRPADTRPYVGDSGRALEGPVDAATVGIGMTVLALAVGFVIGLVVFLLITLSEWLTDLLWGGLGAGPGAGAGSAWMPLIICSVGGLVIGLWTHFSRNRIDGLETVMAEFKATGNYSLESPAKTTVSFLLPLVFGGAIGFEAGLTGIITAGCCWIRDNLKRAGLRAAHVADVTIAASLSAIFGTPLAGIVADAESEPPENVADRARDARGEPDVNDFTMRRGVKIVLYTTAAIGAFAGVHTVSSLFGAASGLPRFDAISAEGAGLLWALPSIVAGYALTLVHHGSRTGFGLIAERLGDSPLATVAKPVVAGVIMGACAIAFPLVLFPGESQCHELMGEWGTWTATALILTGLLKAAITPMCLQMGWMGGAFFPSIFAGVSCGYGLALLTGADPMLMVTVVTSAFLAGVTRKPLLSLAILALCFPLDGILFSGLAAVIGAALPLPRNMWKRV